LGSGFRVQRIEQGVFVEEEWRAAFAKDLTSDDVEYQEMFAADCESLRARLERRWLSSLLQWLFEDEICIVDVMLTAGLWGGCNITRKNTLSLGTDDVVNEDKGTHQLWG